jgi:HAD superfamily hydrolase (TIGR01509 family)
LIRALIFDFDGLILDTEVPEYQSWQEIYREHGCEMPLSVWADSIGRVAGYFDAHSHLESQAGYAIDRDAVRAKRRPRFARLIEEQPVQPGVEAWIADARRLGLKVGVASGSPRDWIVGHLSRLGLHTHFDCIKSFDDVRHTKPDPEVYLAALETLGVHAHEAIALEDSLHGAAAAKAAGIFCIAVPNPLTRHLDWRNAEMCVASLADLSLETLLSRLNRGDEDRP